MSSQSSAIGPDDLGVPVSYCEICDPGKCVVDIADEPCGHDYSRRRTFWWPVVPVDREARVPER